jgi:hypothetical protein
MVGGARYHVSRVIEAVGGIMTAVIAGAMKRDRRLV